MRTAVVRSGVGETINLGSGLGGAQLLAAVFGPASLRTATTEQSPGVSERGWSGMVTTGGRCADGSERRVTP
jgi:hypothetical protein